MYQKSELTRRLITVAIALFVGALHFVTGPQYSGPFPGFVNGYLIDILLPFAMYLVFRLNDFAFLRPRWVAALILFLFGCTVEGLQYYGKPLFGSTFDPFDILAYGFGVVLGMVFDAWLRPDSIEERNGTDV